MFGLENCPAFLGTQELTSLVQIVEWQSEAGWYHLKVKNRVKMVEDILRKLWEWRKKFIFAGGDWRSTVGLADKEARLKVLTNFQWLKCKIYCF